jgi:putative transposase
MASTYLSLHYHIVFSTNQREPMIKEAWRSRLHDYLAGTVLGLKGHCRAVGGTNDHVHLLIGLSAMHTLANFMREMKVASSKWVHEEVRERGFAWQEGYAAFTVSASAVDEVRKYIASQAEHHRARTFREELKALLDRSGVVYDERYLD